MRAVIALVALAVLLGVVYALHVVRVIAGRDGGLKTGEGRFALTTLFIPLGIILFRSMYFYRVDALLDELAIKT